VTELRGFWSKRMMKKIWGKNKREDDEEGFRFKKKTLENVDIDTRKKREDDEKWKKLSADDSLLNTMDM